MLYLEDYLEMIEHLPQELRDRFTEMREMDLQVQNAVDSLDERVKAFFANAKRISTEQQEEECRRICEDYQHAILDAEEKVQIANQIYDLVERYLRKLDQELQKFKIELEADNAGITEILEKRSLELDNTTSTTTTQPPAVTTQPSRHGEKRRASASTHGPLSHGGSSQHSGSGHSESKKQHVDKMHAPEPLIRTNPVTPNALAPPARVASPLSRASSADSTRSADVLVASGSLGLGSQAIAAAASQAIAATQQMQQGRRSASLKASYEAIAVQNLAAREFTLGSRDIASLTPTAGGGGAASGTGSVGTGAAATGHSTPTTPSAASSTGGGVLSLSSSISALLEAPVATPTSRKSSKKARPSANQTSSANSAAHHLLDSTTDTNANTNPTSFGSSTLAATEEAASIETPAQANNEWQYDPNEPRYCICNQVSYGDMVACDNEGCPFEWFHYPCVNISQPPKGKWFCPQCTASMKRRGKLR